MPSTYSANLGIELPATGDQAGLWGVTTNTNLGTLVEQAISGYVTQTISNIGDTTVTIPNGASGVGRNMYLELVGTLSGARNLIVPSNKKLYFIYNNTTGGYAVTVKVTGQTGVSVPNGQKFLLVCDGTDVVPATSYATSGVVVPANPTAVVGTSVVNGSADTYMRSDAAPALDLTISPTWTGGHTFNGTFGGTGVATYFASPPAIGGTAPAGAAFTTLSASSTISGAGFSAYFASPPQLGVSAPNGARFTFAHTAFIAVAFSASTMTVDCSTSNVFSTTLTGNVTSGPTMLNPKDGQTINWFLTQDGTGSRTMTWPAGFKWAGGTAGVLSTAANAVDLLVATYRAGNAFWYASLLKDFK